MLGQLEIRCGGHVRPLGTPKQRTLLGTLLIRANRLVTHDELTDELWGARPPASANANIRAYVNRIRQTLPDSERHRLHTRTAGYSFVVAPDELDVTLFERWSALGRTALDAGDPTAAVPHLERAQGLWRGSPLEGLMHGPRMSDFVRTLAEQRLASTEDLLDARVRHGADTAVTSGLRLFVAANPLRERAWQLLVQALDDTGARAAALAAYSEARQVLADELGVDPGPELRELHQTILHGRSRVSIPAAPSSVPRVPRELPADAALFVGRERELARLTSVITADQGYRGRSVVVGVTGQAGIGKSALAIRCAHAVADTFPDGQLYLDLGQDLAPTTLKVLHRVLRSLLGVEARLPVETSEAAALFRSTIAERRILLVLDGVRDGGLLTGVVPSSRSCALIFTSRRMLRGSDADLTLRLGPLSLPEAVDMLTRSCPTSEEALQVIAQACDGLPLALDIARRHITDIPRSAVQAVALRLADPLRRLDELTVDGWSVRDSLRRHYQDLGCRTDAVGRAAARLFPVLSRVSPILRAADLAAYSDLPPTVTETALERLVQECLLAPAVSGVYTMHSLLRLYSAEIARVELGAAVGQMPPTFGCLGEPVHRVVDLPRQITDNHPVAPLGRAKMS